MMQQINFLKYQGTGNDFILIEDRANKIKLTQKQIALLCNRRFGIGADGLMLLRFKDGYDFEMVYFNSDGNESTMCGNGGRCIVAFAKKLQIINEKALFWAIDGEHTASIKSNGLVKLGMIKVDTIKDIDANTAQLFTGSPHYVHFTKDKLFNDSDFVTRAKEIRFGLNFKQEGINVNHVKLKNKTSIEMRTYERGVEDETFSCGTGAVAAALGTHHLYIQDTGFHTIDITTLGGNLSVSFEYEGGYKEINLIGPAEFVFNGIIEI